MFRIGDKVTMFAYVKEWGEVYNGEIGTVVDISKFYIKVEFDVEICSMSNYLVFEDEIELVQSAKFEEPL